MSYLAWKIEKFLKEFQPEEKSVSNIDFSPILRDSYELCYPVGNASFGNPDDTIFVPPIVAGDENDLILGDKTVFVDISENLNCCGLEKFICGISKSGTPIFVCDNHNFVLEAWQLIKSSKPTLIHIDQHRDEAVCKCGKDGDIQDTRICDYIDYAIKNEWISTDFLSFTESADLCKLNDIPTENKIVNVDVDIFVPDCTILSVEEKVQIICESAKNASLITIATSPGFIGQELSVEIAKLLWKYL
jgi:hypothetical protein